MDMSTCPRCKSENSEEIKSWDVIPKTGRGKPMRVTLYRCNVCGYKYRKATKIEVPSPKVSEVQPTPQIQVADEIIKLMIVKESTFESNGGSEIANKLFEYIKAHDGLLNIKQCSVDLEVEPALIKETLEKLLDEGKIAKIEEAEKPTETVKEYSEPEPPTSPPQEEPQKLSLLQRIKKAFTG